MLTPIFIILQFPIIRNSLTVLSVKVVFTPLTEGLKKIAPNNANHTKFLKEVKKRLKDVEMSDTMLDLLELLATGASDKWLEIITDRSQLEQGNRAPLKTAAAGVTGEHDNFADLKDNLLQTTKPASKVTATKKAPKEEAVKSKEVSEDDAEEEHKPLSSLKLSVQIYSSGTMLDHITNFGLFTTRARIRDRSMETFFVNSMAQSEEASEIFYDEIMENPDDKVLQSFLIRRSG